jgi:hypothetical protein
MGNVPLTFAEIHAWQSLAGADLQPWEVRTLRRMSIAYCSQAQESTRPGCPPPWSFDPSSPDFDRPKVAARVRSLLRA